MELIMKIKSENNKNERVLLPYLHWGSNIALLYSPYTSGLQRKELSREIPEFSRTAMVNENRIFCIGGKNE